MEILRKYLLVLILITLSFSIGALLFSDTKVKDRIPYISCKENCDTSKEIAGIVTSVLVQKTPFLIPQVVAETDKAFAIKNPAPQSPVHYVIFPKKDIKNIADVSQEDSEYIMDVYSVIAELVKRDKLVNYQVITNGPGYQHTSYLHFHLRAEK